MAGGVSGRGVHGRGCAWQWGACVAGGCVWQGSVHGRGACVVGACMAHTLPILRDAVNERAVRILLECILVIIVTTAAMEKIDIMVTRVGVHTVVTTATKRNEFISTLRCVNKPIA